MDLDLTRVFRDGLDPVAVGSLAEKDTLPRHGPALWLRCSRLDGEAELLGGLPAERVGDLHREDERAGRGRRPGQLVADDGRGVRGAEREAGRELAGGHRPGDPCQGAATPDET